MQAYARQRAQEEDVQNRLAHKTKEAYDREMAKKAGVGAQLVVLVGELRCVPGCFDSREF